jgi:hypothetical protein
MSKTSNPYRPYDDGHFFIDLNQNYPPETANAFLCKRAIAGIGPSCYSDHDCIGGADRDFFSGKWRADIHKPYDEETESDIIPVGEFHTQAAALEALWGNRLMAHSRV